MLSKLELCNICYFEEYDNHHKHTLTLELNAQSLVKVQEQYETLIL